MFGLRRLTAAALIAVALTACSKKPPEPSFASSATSPGYAASYPEQLASVRTAYFDQEKAVNTATSEFSGYPDALEEPDWEVVSSVVTYADQEGRSQAYAENVERLDAVQQFYEEDKEDIRRKVAGAVQYQAKKKQCTGDVGSAAAVALDKAMEERIEERLHEASDAHTVIEEHEDVLGKKNVETLEEQADSIALASYMTHIGVVETKLRLRRMIEEAEQVDSTLERAIADMKELEKDEKLEDDARKRIEERRTRAEQARTRIEAERSGAENLSKEIEKRIETLQKKYADAITALVEKIQKRRSDGAKSDG